MNKHITKRETTVPRALTRTITEPTSQRNSRHPTHSSVQTDSSGQGGNTALLNPEVHTSDQARCREPLNLRYTRGTEHSSAGLDISAERSKK